MRSLSKDHTPKDGVITLGTGIENQSAIFYIADTGVGIEAEHLPRIFDRFYRTDESRNRRTGGAGLGLAICKGIIDAHGGKIEVFSSVGSGTTFVVRIPSQHK